jgi:hypothetical protein
MADTVQNAVSPLALKVPDILTGSRVHGIISSFWVRGRSPILQVDPLGILVGPAGLVRCGAATLKAESQRVVRAGHEYRMAFYNVGQIGAVFGVDAARHGSKL